MFVGIPNPNIIVPLSKLHIMPIDPVMKTPLDDGFDVLYNPEKYVQGRSVNYADTAGLSMDAPITQFAHGTAEILSFTLFFDSFIIKEQTELLGTFRGNVIFAYQIAGADINTPYQKFWVNDSREQLHHRPHYFLG